MPTPTSSTFSRASAGGAAARAAPASAVPSAATRNWRRDRTDSFISTLPSSACRISRDPHRTSGEQLGDRRLALLERLHRAAQLLQDGQVEVAGRLPALLELQMLAVPE